MLINKVIDVHFARPQPITVQELSCIHSVSEVWLTEGESGLLGLADALLAWDEPASRA